MKHQIDSCTNQEHSIYSCSCGFEERLDIINDHIQIENGVFPRDKWEDCPNPQCGNQGSYGVEHPIYDEGNVESMGYPILVGYDIEHVQCEFCWTNHRSVYYQENLRDNLDSMPVDC